VIIVVRCCASRKAAEHHRSPQRKRVVCMKFADAFWNAALLCRFFQSPALE
jgi:hypothetical protein